MNQIVHEWAPLSYKVRGTPATSNTGDRERGVEEKGGMSLRKKPTRIMCTTENVLFPMNKIASFPLYTLKTNEENWRKYEAF
jgi:hypothetical protein